MMNFEIEDLTRETEFNGFQTFNNWVNNFLTEAIEEHLVDILTGEKTTKEVLVAAIDESRADVLIELANDYVIDAELEEDYMKYAVGEEFESLQDLMESIVDEFKGKNIYETESPFATEDLIIVTANDRYYLARGEA